MGNYFIMTNNKKRIIIISIIFFIVLITLIISQIIIINNINKMKDDKLYISIYQYEVENYNIDYNTKRKLYKRIEFNIDTVYTETIYSLDNNYYNKVVIENGKCYVSEANCLNQICLKNVLTIDKDKVGAKTIVCMPSGLYIELSN